MKRCIFVCSLVFAALAWAALSAEASILPGTWVPGTKNAYQDQDVQGIFDLDNDGTLTVGDVLVGLLRIDDRTTPSPGVTIDPAGKSLYGVFSHEVQSITQGIPFPGFTEYHVRTGPVVNPAALGWIDLPSLAPQAVAVAGQGSVVAAVYEDIPIDLINNLPAIAAANTVTNRLSVLDYIRYIDQVANLDAVFGFGTGPTEGDDFWVSNSANPLIPANDVFANLTLFAQANFPTPVGAAFDAGLSAIGGPLEPNVEPPDQAYFLELVQNGLIIPPVSTFYGNDGQPGVALVDDDGNAIVDDAGEWGWPGSDDVVPIQPSLHELIVAGGNVTGAANLFFPDPVFGPNNPFFGDPATLLPGPDGLFNGVGDAFMPAETNPGVDGLYGTPDDIAVNFYGSSSNADLEMFPIPEPASVAIWSLLGLVGAVVMWRRRRKAA